MVKEKQKLKPVDVYVGLTFIIYLVGLVVGLVVLPFREGIKDVREWYETQCREYR